MRINVKDLMAMYPNFTLDDRNAPVALKKAETVFSDITDQSRTVAEVKLNQQERNRS